MKHYLLLGICLSFSFFGYSQSVYPPILWTSFINSSPTDPFDGGIEIYDIAVEPSSGSAYIVANCFSTCTIAPGVTITPDPNGQSTVLIKYDGNGQFLWANDLGDLGVGYSAVYITTNLQGGVYISAAYSVDEIDFGNGVKATKSCVGTCAEIFVAKIESSGLAKWARSVSGDIINFGLAPVGLELDPSGALYLAGNYTGQNLDFGNNLQYSNLPVNNFFIAKYDAATGIPQIAFFAAPTSGAASASHLAVNANNQMTLAGSFFGTLKFSDGLSIVAPSNGTGYFIAGLNTNGASQWVRQISSSNDYYDVLGIDMDGAGNAYLAIDADTDLKLDNSTILTINSAYAGIVLKLDENTFSVPVFIEFDTDDYAVVDVKLDLLGNIYTAGYTTAPIEVAGNVVGIDGCFDALLTATSKDGLFQWARSIGGTGCEAIPNPYFASSLAFDQNGFMYSAGLFIQGFSEDGFSAAGTGSFVAKYNTSIVGTDEPSALGTLLISPNPNDGVFSIQLSETPASNAQLTVYDLSGREVLRQEISQEQTAIHTALLAGAYLVVVQHGEHLDRQRLVIQR